MKKLIALLAIGVIGFGVTAPAFAQTRSTTDTTKVRKSRKKPVKKKPKDTTTVKL
ncbi:MAG: hypothetical protein ACXVJB_08180 [Mucilaginibacter sp.]